MVHLQPRTNLRQYCTRYDLSVDAASARSSPIVDRFGNEVQHFAVMPEHAELRIVARSHVVTLPTSGGEVPHDVDARAAACRPARSRSWRTTARPRRTSCSDRRSRGSPKPSPRPAGDLAAYFLAAGSFVHDAFSYQSGITDVRTTVADVIDAGAGVCQDFAHVLIALARSAGHPGALRERLRVPRCGRHARRRSVARVGRSLSAATPRPSNSRQRLTNDMSG